MSSNLSLKSACFGVVLLGWFFLNILTDSNNGNEDSICGSSFTFDNCQCIKDNGSDLLHEIQQAEQEHKMKLQGYIEAAKVYYIDKIKLKAFQESMLMCRTQKKEAEAKLNDMRNQSAILKVKIDQCRMKENQVGDLLEKLSRCYSPVHMLVKKLQRQQNMLKNEEQKMKMFQANENKAADCRAMVMVSKVKINSIKIYIETLIEDKDRKMTDCKKMEPLVNKERRDFETSCPMKDLEDKLAVQTALLANISHIQATIARADLCIENDYKYGGNELRKRALSRLENLETFQDSYLSAGERVRYLWTEYCFLRLADPSLCLDKDEPRLMRKHNEILKEADQKAHQEADQNFIKDIKGNR